MASITFQSGTVVPSAWLNDVNTFVWTVFNGKSTPGTNGTLLQSNGINIVNTIATYPSAAGTSGTILQSNGTGIVNTTAIYPATTAINQLLYSSTANTIGGLSTANSGVLVTSASGVPSISSTLPSLLSIPSSLEGQGATIASATTVVLNNTDGNYIHISGTTTITAITLAQGARRVVVFDGILTLTNGASLILPSGANITTAAGDTAVFEGEAAGVVRCLNYTRATNGVLPVGFGMSPITNSLGADVLLNNTANYFDGPSVAQGTVGTWFVSGTVTVIDTGVAANFPAKLWDGTTVLSSCQMNVATANNGVIISLSGVITSPAGNLRISVKDISATTGKILFNASGNLKDSTITAIRIA